MRMQFNGRVILAALALLALFVVWFTFAGGPRPVSVPTPPADPLPAELESLRSDAFAFQVKGEWCRARDAWRQLIEKLRNNRDFTAAEEEAKTNYEIVEQRCEPGQEMVGPGAKIDVQKNSAMPIAVNDLLRQYPAGKTIRSLGLLDITGRGANQAWGLESEAYFAYESRFALETKVLANLGRSADFEAGIREVAQNLAVDDVTIQLAAFDSPILQVVWEWADPLLDATPYYRTARRVAELANTIDPQAKRSLTWFHGRLKQGGTDLGPGLAERWLVAKLDALSGHRFRLTYVPGFGVQTIEILGGHLLPKDDVEGFARNSGVLMDYVISDVLQTEVGKSFKVDAADVVRMIGLNYDVEVGGSITLRREEDTDGLAVMSVVDGEIIVEASVEGVRRTGSLRPRTGVVKYDAAARFVRWAQIEWQANVDWFSTAHLLFGTRGMRDLKVQSHYEAEQIP